MRANRTRAWAALTICLISISVTGSMDISRPEGIGTSDAVQTSPFRLEGGEAIQIVEVPDGDGTIKSAVLNGPKKCGLSCGWDSAASTAPENGE